MSGEGLPGEVRVLTDPIAVAAAAAGWISDVCRPLDRFRIAASGGSTPHFLYEALASSTFASGIDWQRWQVFFSDERAVPPDDVASNYRLVVDTLLSKVAVPGGQVHRMEAERADLDAAAVDYSRLLQVQCGDPPRLDVVLLGLGADGHTASLFPGTAALDVSDAWAARGLSNHAPVDRLTLTLPALNAAARVAFVVTGATKAEAMRGVMAGSVPAARVRPDDGELLWFLDTAAARSLS